MRREGKGTKVKEGRRRMKGREDRKEKKGGGKE
jgi:hypothetical protein